MINLNLKLGKRKIIAINNSRLITLPKIWIDSLDLKAKDYLDVELEGDKLILNKIKNDETIK